MTARRSVFVLAAALLAACGGAAGAGMAGAADPSSSSMASTSSAPVVNHVHGAVVGATPTQILLGTHYGLRISDDSGMTWQPVGSVGNDMVAAIVKLSGGYVGAFEPMGAMGSASAAAAYVMHSTDGQHWARSTGLAAGSISNLVAASTGEDAWASITNVGVFHSVDGGSTWTVALPTVKVLTAIEQVGTTLLLATQEGVETTSTTRPAMPAAPALAGAVNDLSPWSACPSCVVATLAGGDIATSRDAGQTWQTLKTGHAFDSVVSSPGAAATFFGMVASPVAADQGLWRSPDGGRTWSAVLKQPNVDRMLGLTGVGAPLLAFQWGITVWRSTDIGVTWTKLATLSGTM